MNHGITNKSLGNKMFSSSKVTHNKIKFVNMQRIIRLHCKESHVDTVFIDIDTVFGTHS